MKSARKRQLAILAALLLVVLAALYFSGWYSAPKNTSTARPSTVRPADAAPAKGAPENAVPPAGRGVSMAAVPKPAGWAGKDLYVAYEQAGNLADIIDNLKAAADGGDANAQGVYAFALTECAMLSMNPHLLDEIPSHNEARKNVGRAPIPAALVKHYADRCQQLVLSRKITDAEIDAMRHNAASGGDPLSFAIDFADAAPSLPPEDRQQEILSILQSRNPYAISVLADLMGQPVAGDTLGYGNFAGAHFDKYAWQFVACDLGMDCSGTGAFATRTCLRYSLCGAGDYKSTVENSGLSPEAYQQAVELERKILAAFQTGDFDGVVFGKAE